MSDAIPSIRTFADLGLSDAVMATIREIGYESPSPIQAATIPALLSGRDVLGQAQTGTGKTAAFATPILSRLDMAQKKPQALVLAPTRELAIQVAEAFQRYASRLPGFHVLPIYGGQSYGPQLAALRRGAHVVVGTPGRVIDHLERGTLDLSELKRLVLDEADEMLRMGFIDDVETVLKKIPETRQVALFSATMPAPIRRIAQTYLRDPVEVTITTKTTTAANIRQRYWWVSGVHKLDALTRILEAEPFDAMILFARTKAGTEELAEKLQARGFAAAAINGDMQQLQRERTIQQLKDRKLDILVATDVAARGLDVERISHVLNYDIPYDTESYVHRIGRTGRAGRSGEAILFVTPREKNMLRAIERATRQPIEEMSLPSVETVNDQRIARFLERISATLDAQDDDSTHDLALYRDLIQRYEREHDVPAVDIAAALARLLQGSKPLLLDKDIRERSTAERKRQKTPHADADTSKPKRGRPAQAESSIEPATATQHGERKSRARTHSDETPSIGMDHYRIEVGHVHGVKPANIVGAIANEAGLDSQYIGRIDIHDDHTLLDLPEGMPAEILAHLKKVWVSGQQLKIRRLDGTGGQRSAADARRKPARTDARKTKPTSVKPSGKSKTRTKPRHG
ncbi:MAG: DEAD/DEAH box helicase [Xanthomonadaceae bacterium]|jgi:ATP-dependent RNA helicase DeaD|nr:DEAD/DEAH box helicase [Xanthomonadaceae bacterium]